MRTPLLYCCLLGLLSAPSIALANDACNAEVEPAATLLLPYFEVDLSRPDGPTTLLSINNAARQPALAHITLWTDMGVPTVNFHVFLTGFDVQTINMRDVFRGFLPVTADAERDPLDELSPAGESGWDGTIDGCDLFLPYTNPIIPGGLLEFMRDGHRGRPAAFAQGNCLGFDHDDDLVRGYLTIDHVNRCDLPLPGDTGYFAPGGTGIASNANQLWGDFFLVDPSQDSAQGEPLVHIQAFEDTFTAGDYTFYGASIGASALDAREPLPNAFAGRYLNGGAFDGGTDFLVWRDTKAGVGEPFACDQPPSWFPLWQNQVYAFDEQESWSNTCGFQAFSDSQASSGGRLTPPLPREYCMPLASQRLSVGGTSATGDRLSVPYDFGWLYLPMDHFSDGGQYEYLAQGWVVPVHQASGRYSIGLSAVALQSVCDGVESYLDLF